MKKFPTPLYYYLSFLLMPVLGLLQTKILTTILPLETFGAIQLVLPLLGWTVLIGGMGAPQFLIRYYSKEGMKVYQEGLFISVSSIILIGLIGSFFVIYFKPDYKGLDITIGMSILFILSALAQQTMALVNALLRAQERHVFYNATLIVAKIFLVVGGISGVLWMAKFPIKGYLLGTFVGLSAWLLLLIVFFKMEYLLKVKAPSWRTITLLTNYGLPIVGIMLLGNMLPNFNRYIILDALDTQAVAKYAVGCMISALCFQTLYEPLNTFLHPLVFKAWENNTKRNSRLMICRYLNYYIIIGIIVLGLSIRFEDVLITLIANSNYKLPSGVFAILLLSNFLIGLYRFMSLHYYLERNTTELTLIFFISVSVTLLSAFFLVGIFGLMGAALSVVLGATILVGAVWSRGQKNLRVKIYPRYYLPGLVLSILFIFIPILSVGNISSPLRWLDAAISLIFAVSCSWLAIKIFNKHYSHKIAQQPSK